ncbi:ABC transporter ATP-binding protein [Shouchella shacheensis]|uniref:ABC transporter ATP-binding protein n=1 Tax=Shouchella shacheensis TaxID=1649580 RepID=UPI0007404662|nr:ABC transporter ATP-binding protein [Shouchella shacheensis]
MQPLLVCKQLGKDWTGTVVFTQVSFTLEAGTTLSLVGPSGTGKSTLLRGLAGLESFSKGEIWIEGENISAKRAEQRPIALMFQQPLLFPHLTVLENVAYGLKVKKVRKAERLKIGRDMLARVGLATYEKHYPFECSGGQQQRIALARALVMKPKLLLLDEPFSSIDATLRQSLRDWMRSLLKEEGITTIFVTHDKEEAMLLGDQVAVLIDGQLQQIGLPEEVYERPINQKVAHFFAEGFSDQGVFYPVRSLAVVTDREEIGEKQGAIWSAVIVKQVMKYGQRFAQVRLEEQQRTLLLPIHESMLEGQQVWLLADPWQAITFVEGQSQ